MATQLPMISRILHLLMVDILVVGVAMRRGRQDLGAEDANGKAALINNWSDASASSGKRPSLGVSTASLLAHLNASGH